MLPALPSGVLVDVGPDQALWAHGDSWKARFDGRSFAYVPRLAPTAAHNWPVTFALAAMRCGDSALPLVAGTVQREQTTLTVARGACVERFDLLPSGVEQSWVFASLPERGELRLQLAVTTELVAVDHGDDITFEGQDGGVRYGNAVAIDADGRRCPLSLDWLDGRVQLVVPASFVNTAALPLVVDPFTSTTTLATSAQFVGNADVAFDYSTQEFLAVWQQQYSATDMDVFAQRLDLQQVPMGAPFAIDFTSTSWSLPRVANNGQNDTFLVVAECGDNGNPLRWVGGRIWSLAGGTLPQIIIEKQAVGGSLFGNHIRPDVGGDAAETSGTWFTVVWEREFNPTDHDIWLRQVSPFGALRTVNAIAVDTSFGNETAPRIAKGNGYSLTTALSGQYWPIVYQRTFSPVDEDIRGSLLDANGAFIGPANFAVASSVRDERTPVVSSPTEIIAGHRRHAIAYVRAEPTTSTDVFLAVMDDTGALLATANLHTLEGAGGAQAWPQQSPTIDCDGFRFAVAYSEAFLGSAFDLDVRVSTIGYDVGTATLVANEARVAVAASVAREGAPALASAYSGSGGTVQYGLVLDSLDSSNTSTVQAAVYLGHSSGPLPTTRATACGTLSIGLVDIPALGRVVSFAQGDSGPFSGFIIGSPVTVPLPFCPGCTVGADGPLVANPFSLYVPLSLSLVGLPFACQAWSAYSGTCLGAIALSDTIDFTIL